MDALNAERICDQWRCLVILATYDKTRRQAKEDFERALTPLVEKYKQTPGTPLPQDRALKGSLTTS